MKNQIRVDKVAVCNYYHRGTDKILYGFKFRQVGKKRYNGYSICFLSDKKDNVKKVLKKVQENILKVEVTGGNSKKFYCDIYEIIKPKIKSIEQKITTEIK